MADNKTSWILELVDRITSPAKSIDKVVDDMTEGIDSMTDAVKFSEKETAEALTKSKKYYRDLQREVNQAEFEMMQMKQAAEDAADSSKQKEANKAYDQAKRKVENLKIALKGAKVDMEDLTDQMDEFKEHSSDSFSNVITGMNQGVELIQKAADGLEFTNDYSKLSNQIQLMTDATGKQLDSMTTKTRRIAKVYDEDASEIATAANAMTKNIGGSFEENLKFIEQGYKKGANLNGDFLDQLKEYPTFIKQLGLSQGEAIAFMAQAGKKGIFSDKALDSLKEANLSLREMGKTQIDALAGINITPEQVVDKTPIEAIKLITSQMKGMAPQAKQMILADIFKGAGEDAGLEFIEGIASMEFDITKLKSVESAGAGIKGFFADVSSWAAQTFGNVGVYAQQLAPMFQFIAAGIPVMQMLSKVTWIQNAATKVATAVQWAWNVAMSANPIGVIIMAIAALVGAIIWVASKTEGWGEAWKHTMEGAKLLFKAFVASVKLYFNTMVNGIMMGLNLIKVGWYKFKLAMGIGDESENRAAIEAIHQDTERRKKEIVDGAKEIKGLVKQSNEEFAAAFNSIKWKKDEETADDAQTEPSVNSYLNGSSPEKLGDTTSKGGGKKQGDGINVGSGSGGIKSIAMTLNIDNYFNVSKGVDTRKIADEIIGHVNDKMRDAVINLG